MGATPLSVTGLAPKRKALLPDSVAERGTLLKETGPPAVGVRDVGKEPGLPGLEELFAKGGRLMDAWVVREEVALLRCCLGGWVVSSEKQRAGPALPCAIGPQPLVDRETSDCS